MTTHCQEPPTAVYCNDPGPILCKCCQGGGEHGGNEVGYGAYDCLTCYGTGIWVVDGPLHAETESFRHELDDLGPDTYQLSRR